MKTGDGRSDQLDEEVTLFRHGSKGRLATVTRCSFLGKCFCPLRGEKFTLTVSRIARTRMTRVVCHESGVRAAQRR